MNIQERIEKEWAQDTVADYNENGYAYYTQSPLNTIKKAPIKLLVLGINPGSEKVLAKEKMTPQKLMEGNLYFVSMIQNKKKDPNYKGWHFWERLNNLLDIAGLKYLLNDYSEYVYTNIYLCSSKVQKEISDNAKLKKHTFKLIDILQPECIICLGQKVMDSVLEQNGFKNDKTCQVPGLPIRYKLINGVKVFGFHHPAYYYSDAEKKLVGGFLGHYYKNTGITAVDPLPEGLELLKNNYLDYKANHIHGQSKGMFDYNELIRLIGEKKSNIEQYREGKLHRIPIGKNNVMKLTISVGDRRIGIRLASVNSDNKWVTPQMENKLLPILEELEKKEECKWWIREKEIPETWFVNLDYKGKTEEELCNIIVNTIDYLKDIEIDNV